MSTAPATPIIPTPAPVTVNIAEPKPATAVAAPVAQTWFQKHERLLIVLMVLWAGYWGVNHYLDNAAAKAETRATVAEQASATAQQAAKDNAAVVAQLLQQHQQMEQTLTAQNAALASALSARQAAVVVQQKTDATLPMTDLANRLKTLGNAPDGSVTVPSVPVNTVSLTQPAAVAVVQTLETVPQLQADLKDEQTANGHFQDTIAQADVLYASQVKQITDLNALVVTNNNACVADKNALKAEAKKNNLKWFRRGFVLGNVTGFLGGLYAHTLGL